MGGTVLDAGAHGGFPITKSLERLEAPIGPTPTRQD